MDVLDRILIYEKKSMHFRDTDSMHGLELDLGTRCDPRPETISTYISNYRIYVCMYRLLLMHEGCTANTTRALGAACASWAQVITARGHEPIYLLLIVS